MNRLLDSSTMTLPNEFCWTRMGIEAGQPLQSILSRKEQEREANSGLFFWGIGNAIGPSITELVRQNPCPEVIFSPIKSAARRVDSNPHNVAAWTAAEGLDGASYELPSRTLITSRFDALSRKACHYALVCSSHKALTKVNEVGTVDIGELQNLVTGRPVVASQVTAVVRRCECRVAPVRAYDVLLRARLVAPFFLRLGNPVPLSKGDEIQAWDSAVGSIWAEALVANLR